MSRGIVIAVALVIAPIIAAVAAASGGALDWLSGNTSSAALIADDVRLGSPLGGATPSTDSEVDLGVVGAPIDCPPTGVGPEDSESLFQRQDDRFWVAGTLASFDGMTAIVAGPSGDITATLADDFNLVGDLSPGAAVEMAGTVAGDGSMTASELRSACAGAGVIDCATEEDPHFQLVIDGATFEVTGRLDSLTTDKVSVLGPGLLVEMSRDASTAIEGGLDAGDPVRVEGTVLDAQQLRALAVALHCEGAFTATPTAGAREAAVNEDAADDDDDADDDANDDKDNEKDKEKCNPGEARGNGAQRLKVHKKKAMIRNSSVLSRDGDTLTVDTPFGPVSVLVDEDTDVSDDVASALEVWVTGEMQGDGSILADEIKVTCSDHGNGSDAEGEDEDDDEDEED